MRKINKIFGVILIIFALIMIDTRFYRVEASTKEYKAGDEVTINDKYYGKYTLKITGVRETSERNQYSHENPKQVFIIDYEYTYLEASEEEYKLWLDSSTFKIVDSNNVVGYTYPISGDNGSRNPKLISPGTKSKSQVAYGVDNYSNTFKLKHTSADEKTTVTFALNKSENVTDNSTKSTNVDVSKFSNLHYINEDAIVNEEQNGKYKIKITGVKETTERNSYVNYTPAQVFIIDYEYTLLEKSQYSDTLYIFGDDFQLIDGNNEAGNVYPLISYKQSTPVEEGETCKAQAVFSVNNYTDNFVLRYAWTSENTEFFYLNKSGKASYPNGIPFRDVKNSDWYYNAVKFNFTNNIISGYNPSTFAPNDKLTRAMMVAILYNMENSPWNNGVSKFSDVASNQWYSKAIKWATDNKIVSGYSGTNKFGPNNNILRQDVAVILNNYAKYKKKNTTTNGNLTKFKDNNKVDFYANYAMKWAVGHSVITGNADGTLNPKGNATRAEAAAMIQKYCNNVGR